MAELYKFVPFKPSDYDGLRLSNNEYFYVRYPIDNIIEFRFYNSRAETNRVDKTKFLRNATTMYGVFRDEFSVTSISISLEYNGVFNYNYVYIPYLDRYYFISKVNYVRTNLCELDLTIDVLMTYRNHIKTLKAFVDRNEYTYDPYIVDKKRVIKVGNSYNTYEIPNSLFSPTELWFVLTGLLLGVKEVLRH